MAAKRPSRFRRKYLKDRQFIGFRMPWGSGNIKRDARRKERALLEAMAEARATGKVSEKVDLKERLMAPSFTENKKRFEMVAERMKEEKKLVNEFYRHQKKMPAYSKRAREKGKR